jgi:hypothetical protein
VRRRDRRVTVEGTDADAAQGAAMEVSGDDGPPEALVADGGAVSLLVGQRLFDPRIFGAFQQLFAVDESAAVDGALPRDRPPRLRGEVRLDQDASKPVPALP